MSMPIDDPFSLQRFVKAQQDVYADVCAELRAGAKQSHWMWFIFPQIEGLGSSSMAKQLAIGSQQEAQAYLQHPLLGPRLRECTALVNRVERRSLEQILPWPDHMKFRSSMTLFAQVTADNAVFLEALRKYCDGEPDPRTLEQLRAMRT